MLRDAVMDGTISEAQRQALRRAARPVPEAPARDRWPFTRQERDAVLAWFRAHAPHHLPLVGWQFSTGMRPSEALALRWGVSLDLTRRWCEVTHTRDGTELVPCKTRRSRRSMRLTRAAVAFVSRMRQRDGELVFR